MNQKTQDDVRTAVRERYGSVARSTTSSCCSTSGCCGQNAEASLKVGYSAEDLATAPEGANMGLGCGNPHAIAALQPGETVLDLGAGGGFDCFLAAKQVGPSGQVIGVDMTPDMVSKARQNAQKLDTDNVEFRLGEIEHLPVANDTIDVILSNCVINLSPAKEAVFRDAWRVLKPGGRLAVSDVVLIRPLPQALANDVAALTGCIAGASTTENLRSLLAAAGFEEIQIGEKPGSREFIRDWMPGSGIEDYATSANIQAIKRGKIRDAAHPLTQRKQ